MGQGFRACAMQSKSTMAFWTREGKNIFSGQPSYCIGEEAYRINGGMEGDVSIETGS